MAFYDVFHAFILRCLFSGCEIDACAYHVAFSNESATKMNSPQQWESNFWTGHGDFFPKEKR